MQLNGHFFGASLEYVQIYDQARARFCRFPSRLDEYSFTHMEGTLSSAISPKADNTLDNTFE